MGDIKFSVKALAALKGMNLNELAEAANINQNHLKDLSAGRVRMTADDLKKLSAATGIPMDNIQA
ncbi:helix-turn-helix domain-containing protein [Anaerolactibacter massiliensis]|uniref:helix-turn-helix domain-containing protein n=1 Tax=Anaerolactibacter massiliensis TaxID=2044573 RepID=UPI000CF883D6|nr:helix-turn-helix transcriptional regulator [Anaerolactibacter massiliensis]